MKTKLLSGILIILVIACNPKQSIPDKTSLTSDAISKSDIEIVLQLIDCPGSGYTYLYDNYTIEAEMSHFDSLSKSIKPGYLRDLILVHYGRTQGTKFSDSTNLLPFINAQEARKLTAYTKPPNPCPITGHICATGAEALSFFDGFSGDSLIVTVNNRSIKADTAFKDNLTKIKTIILNERIDGKKGEFIKVQKVDNNKAIIASYTQVIQ